MDGVSKRPYTLRGTARFATSRSQGSEAEQTNRPDLEAAACQAVPVASGEHPGSDSVIDRNPSLVTRHVPPTTVPCDREPTLADHGPGRIAGGPGDGNKVVGHAERAAGKLMVQRRTI